MGSGVDIHKQILKLAPRKGFVLPGHKYTGPGNPLESQLKYDPQTGEILEIYEQPTGRTDAVSMSSIGGMFYSSFLGGNLIKVGGNKLTPMTS